MCHLIYAVECSRGHGYATGSVGQLHNVCKLLAGVLAEIVLQSGVAYQIVHKLRAVVQFNGGSAIVGKVSVVIASLASRSHIAYGLHHLLVSSLCPYVYVARRAHVRVGVEQGVSLSFKQARAESFAPECFRNFSCVDVYLCVEFGYLAA